MLDILNHYRDQLPKRIFDHPFEVPIYKNGNIRPGLRKAFKLLDEAGFEVRDFRMVNKKTGRPLTLRVPDPRPRLQALGRCRSSATCCGWAST